MATFNPAGPIVGGILGDMHFSSLIPYVRKASLGGAAEVLEQVEQLAGDFAWAEAVITSSCRQGCVDGRGESGDPVQEIETQPVHLRDDAQTSS